MEQAADRAVAAAQGQVVATAAGLASRHGKHAECGHVDVGDVGQIDHNVAVVQLEVLVDRVRTCHVLRPSKFPLSTRVGPSVTMSMLLAPPELLPCTHRDAVDPEMVASPGVELGTIFRSALIPASLLTWSALQGRAWTMTETVAADAGCTMARAAELTGLTPDTLRYYERDGLLLAAVGRSATGHRRYQESDLRWIELMNCLRGTGMPIRDVRR